MVMGRREGERQQPLFVPHDQIDRSYLCSTMPTDAASGARWT